MKIIVRKWRLLSIFCTDVSMISIAWFSSLLLCASSKPFDFLPVLFIIQTSSFYFCGLYRGIWRFASIPDLIRILKTVGITVVIAMLLSKFYWPISYSIMIVYGALLILLLATPRLIFRWLKDYKHFLKSGERALIIGAGNAGESIVRDLRRLQSNYQPIAFVDDNPRLSGQEIHGIRVRGTCRDIQRLVSDLKIDIILIAVPSASAKEMRHLVSICEQTKKPFRTLHSVEEIKTNKISATALREVSLEDLLGREQVSVNLENMYSFVMNKTVVVTGGGGSIGEELCMQIAMFSPAELIIIENSEYNLYAIDLKLRQRFPNLKLFSLLCDVTDKQGINNIFRQFQPQLVFHAAAYKHVPLLETMVRAAIYNNLIGTKVLAEAAVAQNTEIFILISSDKAVNPSSLMGATKRGAEILCQALHDNNATHFITVRFGNVLNSTGSIIPLFRKQLQNGEPLTVTHPEMTRFFMTIAEATRLVLQAGAMCKSGSKGGEIFVLEMGEPIKISYLAEQMIKLAGKVLGDDIEIQYIGLRPGEKLYEELLYQEEKLCLTEHPKIYKAEAKHQPWFSKLHIVNKLEQACYDYNEAAILNCLFQLVPEYQPTSTIKKSVNS